MIIGGGRGVTVGKLAEKINIARGTMDPRYTPGSDRNSRAALFSNSVSCPKRVRMIKGSMMMALQKLPTLLMATFKLAERGMFSDRNKTASEMHVEPRIVAHCWPFLGVKPKWDSVCQ